MVFGSQTHSLLLVFIILETILLVWQLARYFYRPEDKHRGWYSLLLSLLLLHNLTAAFLPDPSLALPLPLQIMLIYGTGFIMASYFPFYFYKEFELVKIRRQALIWTPVFLLGPYLFSFVILYPMHGNLNLAIRYGLIVPAVYYLYLLRLIFIAIRKRYHSSGDKKFYVEELTVYFAILPWGALGFLVWFQASILADIICANGGLLVISVIFFFKSARRAKHEHLQKDQLPAGNITPESILASCLRYNLTRTETLIAQKICQGLNSKQIAEVLFVSEYTVKKHTQNIYGKMKVNNRTSFFLKLQNERI